VNILSLNSKGVIAVGGIDKEITLEDVHRVEEAATVVQLPPNREILQVFPRNYRLDGQDNIKDPVGMSGVRLEVDAHIITGSTPALKNIERCLNQTGIVANQFVVNVLAASRVVLDKRQRESGTAVIDIGSSTTGLAVYEEGEILHTAVIPVGSAHITNDLAIGLKTDLDTAEHVKRTKTRIADSKKSSKTHTITEKDSSNERTFKQKDIDHITEARLVELFGLINSELKKVGRAGKLPGGVVIVGGGANLDGIETIAKSVLALNARVSRPTEFSGIIEAAGSPELSAAVGLMVEDMILTADHPPKWNLDRSLSRGTSFVRSLIDRFKP
jgi:cell division protein FtsA